MLLIFLYISFCRMHDTVAVIRRRIERIELHLPRRAVHDIVPRSRWDDDNRAVFHLVLDTVEYHLPLPRFTADELLELVPLLADVLSGLEAHHHKLAILRGVQDAAEIFIL